MSAIVAGMLVAMLLPAAGAAHNDPEGDHSGPGSSGPDAHSRNVKLLANVAKAVGTTTQSDLAFAGRYAYAGHYQGFRVLDVSDPQNPVVVTNFLCNGAQSDLSIHGNLLFQSVDSPQNHGGCSSTAAGVTAATAGMFEGIRIFDVSNPAAPVHLTSIATDCGSHTHTLVPDPANGRVLVYV
ncbi:MAG TPA: hypothetical protein VM344_07925, partial [Vitreimonas sp.]|nr:hypothetical protein [Vitreimonas sp.]